LKLFHLNLLGFALFAFKFLFIFIFDPKLDLALV